MQHPTHPSYETDHDDLHFLEASGAARAGAHEFSPLCRRLALRSSSGTLIGLASFRVFADHFLITRFLARQQRVDLGLKLLQALKAEASRTHKDAIWLETRGRDGAGAFYGSCGFEKKVFYQENPEDPDSLVKEVWLLKQLRAMAA